MRVSAIGSDAVVHLPVGLGFEDERAREGRVGSNPMAVVVAEHDPLSGRLATAATRVHLRLLQRRPHGGPAPRHGGHVA